MSDSPGERNSPAIWYPYDVALRCAERLIKLINWNLNMWQVVGGIRRGEKHVEGIEIVIVPRRARLETLKRAMDRACSGFNEARVNVWTMTFELIPVVVYLARKENFRVLELLRTGPETFVDQIVKCAEAKGHTLHKSGFWEGKRLVVPKLEADLFRSIGFPSLRPDERAEFSRVTWGSSSISYARGERSY